MSQDKVYAIISDIHGNVEAFTTALKFIDQLAVDQILCLGDLVGYGQGAAECLKMARERNVIYVQGNHDAQIRPPRDPRMRAEAVMALDINMKQLTDEEMDWLQNQVHPRVVDDRIVMAHGALTHRDDYILTQDAVVQNMKIMHEKYAGIPVCFFGHSHLGMVIGGGSVRTKFPESTIVPIKPGTPYLINPGSIGQPRDGIPLTSFAIWEPGESELSVVRLEYDIKKEQERMREAGLPEKLWQRIALGK